MGMGEGGDAARPSGGGREGVYLATPPFNTTVDARRSVDAVQFISCRLCGWLRAFGGRGVDGAVMAWLEHHDLGKV